MASGAAGRAKSQAMAADLIKRGYWHGRRQSVGLNNIPNINDVGSAAYRRLKRKEQQQNAKKQR